MEKWQSQIYSTCNQMHELNTLHDGISLLSMKGSWRSTWKFTDGDDSLVLKMLQLDREFDHQSYSYHQIDAMALERLTSSNFVITSYGFCGQSTIVEWAPNDARSVVKDSSIHSTERLRIARDLSRGLNHIHSIDTKQGERASLVHNDLNMANIVNVNKQTLKFNDFNLAVLLKWNKTEPCGYPVRFRGDLWRSPEEVRNDTYVSEKIDIYSVGNVLFQVLTRHQPWTWLEPEGKLEIAQVAQRKLDGKAPSFPLKILESPKLAHQALYYGTLACYEADPTKRPTAYQLAQGFNQALRWVEQHVNISTAEVQNLFVVSNDNLAIRS
jgi:serine/threonine protein kinase